MLLATVVFEACCYLITGFLIILTRIVAIGLRYGGETLQRRLNSTMGHTAAMVELCCLIMMISAGLSLAGVTCVTHYAWLRRTRTRDAVALAALMATFCGVVMCFFGTSLEYLLGATPAIVLTLLITTLLSIAAYLRWSRWLSARRDRLSPEVA